MPFPPQPDWLVPTVQELQDRLDDAKEELYHLHREVQCQEFRVSIAEKEFAKAKAVNED